MKFKFSLIAIFSIIWIFAPEVVFAARINLESSASSMVHRGDVLYVDAVLDSSEKLNALGGILHFPNNILTLQDIRDADSMVNFWVEKPHLVQDDSIVFSGVTPGGLHGERVPVFSLVFKAERDGDITFSLDEGEVFYDDGQGIAHPLNFGGFVTYEGVKNPRTPSLDHEPPESFSVFLGRNEHVFNNHSFIAFVTHDKDSGVDHYEVREGEWGFYTRATSPFVLHNQNLTEKIFVKAVDRNGNERIAELAPGIIVTPWYVYGIISMLILIGLMICLILCRRFIR